MTRFSHQEVHTARLPIGPSVCLFAWCFWRVDSWIQEQRCAVGGSHLLTSAILIRLARCRMAQQITTSSLKYVRPELLVLRDHPHFNEKWVQDRIGEDPALLGLGDLILKDKEQIHPIARKRQLPPPLFQTIPSILEPPWRVHRIMDQAGGRTTC